MFTGLITDLGRVRRIDKTKGGRLRPAAVSEGPARDDTRAGGARLAIETAYDMAAVEMGASIACSGACLTVVEKGPGWFAVDVSAESLARTTIDHEQPAIVGQGSF